MSRFNINSFDKNLVYFDEYSNVFINGFWEKSCELGNKIICSISPKWTDTHPFLIRKGDIICYSGEPSFVIKDILGYEHSKNIFSPSLLVCATKITKKEAEYIKNNADKAFNSKHMRRWLAKYDNKETKKGE